MAKRKQQGIKACEFKAGVLIDGKLTRRMVIGDQETLRTRYAILKSTGKRINITKADYERFRLWFKSSPPNAYGELKERKGTHPLGKVISGGFPSLGKRK